MKKHQLLFLAFALFSFTGFSQDELISNGTFEDTLDIPWGAYADNAANGVDDFRTTDAAYEGTHSIRLWDHTWGVLIWIDIEGIKDSADYTVSFWYKGDVNTLFDLAVGRDLSYDLVNDPDGIVPDTANIVDLNTSVNAAIEWSLTPRADWTHFSYTWGFDDWLGLDPETGDPLTASVAIMFANADYASDAFDGPSTYFDNVSLVRTPRTYVGVDKLRASTLNVYPNPTYNRLHIQADNVINRVRITDLSGREVMTVDHPETTIDVSALNPGLYIISADSEVGTSYINKFIRK